MSFGFLGIQFGFALQNANTSRIFQTLGAKVDDLPILWIAAPVTGLLIQPIIGYFSDHTWGRLGRRRPYFLVGAILSSLALLVMPNSPLLWVAAGTLWIMDASINVSMEPFRAFVGDNLPREQRNTGFAMQSFFIGVGSVVASLLPYILSNWFNISSEAPDGIVPDTVKWSFYLGAGVFFFAVLWTIIKSKEYSPEELASFTEEGEDLPYQEAAHSDEWHRISGRRQIVLGSTLAILGTALSFLLYQAELEKELYILSGGIFATGLLFLISGLVQSNGGSKTGFVTMMNDLQAMPKTMKQLAVVQFFSWFALFAMWIYTTSSVTEHVFHTTDTKSLAYNEGADWVGVLFATYNGVAALAALVLPFLADRWGRQLTHLACLCLGGLGLISIFFITDKNMLLVSMIGVGIAWASILSMPYAMLTGALPPPKMGYYMGVFNFFIVIPQIVAATILGTMVSKLFHDKPVYALIVGGISMIIAGFLTFLVDDKDAVRS